MNTVKQEISQCTLCSLYLNQRPLLDTPDTASVMWVGISAKAKQSADETPLSSDTISGALIKQVEEASPQHTFYKSNLVKCLPLTEKLKLRKPTATEYACCASNLVREIEAINPRFVVFLGEDVRKAFCKHTGISMAKPDLTNYFPIIYQGRCLVAIPHPSYMSIYKKTQIPLYVKMTSSLLNKQDFSTISAPYESEYQ